MSWLYLLCGGIALYTVETAEAEEPIHITAMVALLLCLIPTSLDALMSSARNTDLSRIMRKGQIAKSDD